METFLCEVDIDNFTLTTTDGKVYHVNVFDMTICSCWLPTSSIRIFTSGNHLYCTNLSLDSTVRLV
jgi:hypothetical protein